MKKVALPSCPNCQITESVVFKFQKSGFELFFCKKCLNGFTYPQPKNLAKYYSSQYWASNGISGSIKNIFYDFFQLRRGRWVRKFFSSGNILDVGSGEGRFGKSLSGDYRVTNLDPFFSGSNKNVIKKDFLKWNTNKKFDSIVFWESLEHTPCPQKYLEKAYKLLKRNGKIFIEFPRYNSFEPRVFGRNWFHLDLPRHSSHLTDNGLANLLSSVGFNKTILKSVPSFDYAPWGFVASTLSVFGIQPTDYLKKTGNLLFVIFVFPLSLAGLLFEILLMIVNQSPIGLAVAEKK